MGDFINDARVLLDQIWSDKEVSPILLKVTIISKSYVFNKRELNIIDISLNRLRQQEEDKYLRSTFYRKNIRLGNTIIENQKNKYSEFGRKGIQKLFQLKLQHIKHMQKKVKLNTHDAIKAEIIFQGIKKAFQNHKKIQIIKVEKIQGTDFQVSYNPQFQAWIIASQNVSLVANRYDDLKIYTQQRYNALVLLSQQWFKLIENLHKKELKQLEDLLNGYTMIGKYYNSQSHDFIQKKNQKNGLIWFAIVDNYSSQVCLDPLQIKKQLSRFSFQLAKMKSISLTSCSQAFYQLLQKLFVKISEAGLQDEQFGQCGSVIYFVVHEHFKKGLSKQIVVGATIVKTLSYQYLKKMNQYVVREAICQKSAHINLIKGYMKQIKRIQQGAGQCKTSFPLSYYQKILTQFLNLIYYNMPGVTSEYVRKNFRMMLKIVCYSIFKRIPISKYAKILIADQQFKNRIKNICLTTYDGLGCISQIIYIVVGLPGMFKTYLAKQMSIHFGRMNIHFRSIPVEVGQQVQKSIKQKQVTCQQANLKLKHYYLDGSFDCQSIFKVIKYYNQQVGKNSFRKFILIKQEGQHLFNCNSSNEFPFSLQTIIMCYYGQQQKSTGSLSLQEKINLLSIVTQKLKKFANFNTTIHKLNLVQYKFPFGRNLTQISNIGQFQRIIKQLLKSNEEDKQRKLYIELIQRLQSIKALQFISEKQMKNQVQNLIKSSYPMIPTYRFRRNN